MSIEQQIQKLISDTKAALVRSNGRPLAASVDELERGFAGLQAALNGVSKQLGRPRGAGDNEIDQRTLATQWLECKAIADAPKRGSLQTFTPSSEMIDSALTARAAWSKMISLQPLDHVEQKSLSVFNLGNHGYIAPPEWSNRILSCIHETGDVLGSVFSQTIGGSSLHFLIDNVVAEAEWFCDDDCGAPASQDLASGLGDMELRPTQMRFRTCASYSLIQDAAINLEEWLMRKATAAFRRGLARAVMTGDGIGKPIGLLRSGLPIIEPGAGTPAGQVSWQDLVGMWAHLPADYRPNSSWVMNSITLSLLLTLSDAQGRPIILSGLTTGVPLSLLGRPVLIDEKMPDLVPGATPILLADLNALYAVVLRGGPTLLPPVSGYCVNYFFLQRSTGGVQCADAGLLLRVK